MPTQAPNADLRAQLHAETATAPFRELQRFFAAGALMFVDPKLDLLDVAIEVATDQSLVIEARINAQEFGAVTDAQAADWYERDAKLWTCVVRPWVLVQDRPSLA